MGVSNQHILFNSLLLYFFYLNSIVWDLGVAGMVYLTRWFWTYIIMLGLADSSRWDLEVHRYLISTITLLIIELNITFLGSTPLCLKVVRVVLFMARCLTAYYISGSRKSKGYNWTWSMLQYRLLDPPRGTRSSWGQPWCKKCLLIRGKFGSTPPSCLRISSQDIIFKE